MGRWKKDQGWRRDLKKIPCSIGLPKGIKDSLEDVNASEVITELIENNLHKITDGSIQDSIDYKRAKIMDLTLSTIKSQDKMIIDMVRRALDTVLDERERKFFTFEKDIKKELKEHKEAIHVIDKSLKLISRSFKLTKKEIRSIITLEVKSIIKKIVVEADREFVPTVESIYEEYGIENEPKE